MPRAHADEEAVRAADGLLVELQRFAATLDPVERRLLVALLAAGIDAAWTEDPETVGPSLEWTASCLPEHLAATIRARDLHIEGW